MCVCVCVCVCTHEQRETYFKELLGSHDWRLGKSHIWRLGQRLETQGGFGVQIQRPSAGKISFFLREVSLGPSTDWAHPPTMQSNLLYSKSTDFDVHFIQNTTPTDTSWGTFDQFSGFHGPIKSIHKVNHHYNYLLTVSFLFFSFIFVSWRLITLQYCSGFCHTLTWFSHGFTCVPHPEPPSYFPPIPSLCLLFLNGCAIDVWSRTVLHCAGVLQPLWDVWQP